jgi:hypothetical protein
MTLLSEKIKDSSIGSHIGPLDGCAGTPYVEAAIRSQASARRRFFDKNLSRKNVPGAIVTFEDH